MAPSLRPRTRGRCHGLPRQATNQRAYRIDCHMDNPALTVVRGTNSKPVATEALVASLQSAGVPGQLLIGYPIIAAPDGSYAIDALLVSPEHGLICFDLVEGPELGDFAARQDDAYTKLQSRLLAHRELVARRNLLVPINTVTYVPALTVPDQGNEYVVLTRDTFPSGLANLTWPNPSPDVYERALSAIQSITAIRRPRGARHVANPESRGARLQSIEDSISTLDRLQSKAVIETVNGVQRIRGLAGSGKTIVLALKAAYLHSQHPDWRIAVTFNTRSLKAHFTRLINNFSVEQTGDEPDWDRLRILNSWGAPGGSSRDGIYHEFCLAHGLDYRDFNAARSAYGREDAFQGVCTEALAAVPEPKQLYDVILVDEAQDFPPEFLRLCYEILVPPKRLVYAYDELQNLTSAGLPPADEIFGSTNGTPRVSFEPSDYDVGARRDIILEKCYRNSRPVLVTAHGLGFGIYRPAPADGRTGLVQMFAQPELWHDIGYAVKDGYLALGQDVTLARTPETSPLFLESHSPLDDLVLFRTFETEADQAKWVAEQIENDVTVGELRYDDIVIINTNPISARAKLGRVRKALLDRGISSHLAGVDTNPDVFFEVDSITCTGIHRAKGNEAAMVYVINGDECHASAANLSRVRNRLFTAITRSKAWVRVTGIGGKMEALNSEYRRIRESHFELAFRYPTKRELEELTIVHRDMSAAEEKEVLERRRALSRLVTDLKEGRIYPEDLDDADLAALRDLISRTVE